MLIAAVNFLQKQQKQQKQRDLLWQTARRIVQSHRRLRKPGDVVDCDQ